MKLEAHQRLAEERLSKTSVYLLTTEKEHAKLEDELRKSNGMLVRLSEKFHSS